MSDSKEQVEWSTRQQGEAGLNSGILDILNILAMYFCNASSTEPKKFARLLRAYIALQAKEGGDPSFVAWRQYPLKKMNDFLDNLTLAQLRNATPWPDFGVVHGGKSDNEPG